MARVGGSYGTGRFAEVGDLSKVSSHTDVALVVERMLADLRAHPTEWENQTLEHFLDALAGVLDGLPSLYANRGEQFPQSATWKILAEALVGASGYE
jgi:hypothetical protein